MHTVPNSFLHYPNFHYSRFKNNTLMQSLTKRFPYLFLVMICLVITFLYFALVKLLLLDLQPFTDPVLILALVVYNFFLVMLVWSIVQVVRLDPGKVPIAWGFRLENKQRKYCVICHVFKPERSHHCSSCQRCVLNMDHHCPWINSCIGFYNRKAFLLMLFYTIILSFVGDLIFLCAIPKILQIIEYKPPASQYIALTVLFLAMIFNTVIMLTIANFLKFHIELVLRNMTTIETLQLKRQGKEPSDVKSIYDMGKYFNWVQVFGRNSWTWLIPQFCNQQGPAGDGVIWPRAATEAPQLG